MTKQDYLEHHGHLLTHDQRVSVEYSAIVDVSADEFRDATGIEADFSRPDGRTDADEPVSVVYAQHPLTGQYQREREMVSYIGSYPISGPLGGIHAPASEPVTFVVTR